MLSQADIAVLMKAVAEVVKEFVAKSAEPTTKRLDELGARLAALPVPKDGIPGKDAAPLDLAEIAEAAASKVFIDVELIKNLVRKNVAKSIAELPPPKDGKDVDPVELQALADKVNELAAVTTNANNSTLELAVAALDDAKIAIAGVEALKAQPTPKDGERGKDADPEAFLALQLMVKKLQDVSSAHTSEINNVEDKLDALPIPKDGEPGAVGIAGIDGKDGVAGRDGVDGKEGVSGADGVAGKDGADGLNGKDVDPAALEEILGDIALLKSSDVASTAVDLARKAAAAIVMAEERIEILESIPKSPSSFVLDEAGELVAVYPDGTTKTVGVVRGKDGIRGASIMDGHVDDSGQLVLRMSDGRIINAGAVHGKDGAGAEGKPGAPGRDANEIRVLPAIDESKSYPEGTTALYRGGMIRAERTTEPIAGDLLKAGWRVALEGIAEESEQELEDGRIIERTTVYTSGRVFIRRISSRAMIYRGTWKDDDFSCGDTVTWDGSLWHCERDTKARPGGLDNNGDWKLCAKRGAPGKDGQTIKGEQGPTGRPGKDLTQMDFSGGKH